MEKEKETLSSLKEEIEKVTKELFYREKQVNIKTKIKK